MILTARFMPEFQVYIRDQLFDPSQFFTLGRPCKLNCNKDTETTIHNEPESENRVVGTVINHMACSKGHHWLYKKTIADVLESLVGAFIVDSGFKAAMAFLKWMGIHVNFDDSQVSKICIASKSFMSLSDYMDNTAVESSLGYKFLYKGFIVQAFVHPSFNKHTGGCYQRLEFLGDAVLDYLITSYLYSVYPKLKPGQLTDLRSVTVNNNSFAHVAVTRSFQKYLLSDSANLSEAIKKFVNFAQTSISEKNPLDGPTCPKVLGDLVESCVGAILIDTGFNLSHVWRIILTFLDPIMTFSSLYINPVRQLRELCQSHNWDLEFSSSRKGGTFIVEAKARGRRLKKGKSLEEVLKSSTKQQAKLLGFDETPINIIDLDLVPVEHMEIAEVSPAPRLYISKTDPGIGLSASSEEHSSDTFSDTAGISQNGSAKSCVYEICASNYESPTVQMLQRGRRFPLKAQNGFRKISSFPAHEDLKMGYDCFSMPWGFEPSNRELFLKITSSSTPWGFEFTNSKQGRRNKEEVRPPMDLAKNTESVESKAFVLRHLRLGVLLLCLAENDDEDEIKLDPNYRNVEFLITTGPVRHPNLIMRILCLELCLK
ncbi:hypothetical protein GIB67_016776, partial [Kingdonia uniflora]